MRGPAGPIMIGPGRRHMCRRQHLYDPVLDRPEAFDLDPDHIA